MVNIREQEIREAECICLQQIEMAIDVCYQGVSHKPSYIETMGKIHVLAILLLLSRV